METVNVLWTGGWESTFRIVQLSTRNLIIYPYYIRDNRKSEQQEINAMTNISGDIRKLPTTNCSLQDLTILNRSDIKEDKEIAEANKNLLKDGHFGGQYEWLARFAKSVDKLELGIEKGRPYQLIKKYGDIKKVQSKKGEYYILDSAVSSDELIKVFGNFHFPLIDFSKSRIKKEVEKKGFMEVMNKTWFCHKPINNEPCGVCNPCIGTIRGGLTYRFSPAALRRYKIKTTFVSPIKNSLIYKKLSKTYRFLIPTKIN